MSSNLTKKNKHSAPPKASKNSEFFKSPKQPKLPDMPKVTKLPKIPRTP